MAAQSIWIETETFIPMEITVDMGGGVLRVGEFKREETH